MKKCIKILSILLTLFLVINIYMPLGVRADNFIQLKAQSNILKNKTWSIKFNHQIDKGTEKNIAVLDSKNNTIPIIQSLCADGKTVLISPPDGGYKEGETYYILVKDITSNGKAVKPVKMPFTITGDETFEVPDFYVSYLKEKIDTIHSLENAYGSEGDTIAFITDMHYPANSMYSLNLLKKLCETTKLKLIVNGGDNIVDNADISIAKDRKYTFNNLVKRALGDKFVRINGNHDNNSNQTNTLTPEEVYSIDGKGQENIVKPDKDNLKGMYWYIDNPTQKIRYIGLNTFEGTEGVLSVAQMKWLCETALVFPSTGWSVAFFTHATASPRRTGNLGKFRGIIRAIRYKTKYKATYTDYNKANYNINVDFYHANASVLFVANGHIHYDLLDTDNGIGYFASTCDAAYKDNASVPYRIAGTTNSQSFDVITINKKTNTVNLTKIGAGSDRNFTFVNNR